MNESNLHEYQKEAVDHIMKKSHCALFLEMGLGKTVSTLTAIKKLMYEELSIRKTLVIGPKRVVESVWEAECGKWSHLRNLKVSKIVGSTKKRLAALKENADVYLISRDNIAWLIGQFGGNMLPFDMLVIDELSSFKNPKSQRFKALRLVQPSFKRVVGLTGSPAPNGLIDLWSQIYLLDRGERLGKFITRYREDYFRPGKSNGNIVYKYELCKNSENLIYEKIGDICMSMKAKDYLNLPKRITNIIKLKFDPQTEEKYKKFEEQKVLEMFEGQDLDEAISVTHAAALSNKLLQFANGAVYDEDRKVHAIHDIKLEALKEIIDDANGKPVLVAWAFKHDIDRIKEYFKKYNLRELKTDKDIQDWNKGEIQIMTMHPASGGHGLNLQSGGHIIVWFGQTWSLELEEQFNARLDRQGQTEAVIVNKLVMEKTIDIDIIKAIEGKSQNQNKLMEAVKARIKKYVK